MSLATRCPECSTIFKVVPDQLRMSDGWVRCGRCSRVFDGNDHMVVATPGVASSPPADMPDDDDDAPWSALPATTAPWERLPSLDLGGRGEAEAPRVDPSWSFVDFDGAGSKTLGPEAFAFDALPIQASAPSPVLPSSLALPANDPPQQGPEPAPGDERRMPFAVLTPSESSRMPATHSRVDSRADADPSDTAFMGAFAQPATPRRPVARRVALLVLILVAMLVLVAQVLTQSHDAIAARQPTLRPAMLAWCRLAGCTVSPLRDLDDIAIDGSAFERQKSGDGYLLDFTLRNRSGLPLAMPAVELSLLDSRERAVLRRVLHPADFGAPQVLSARGEHHVALPLALAPAQVGSLQPLIVGYRLDPFYP